MRGYSVLSLFLISFLFFFQWTAISYGGDSRRSGPEALLDKYADEGLGAIEETQILTIPPLNQLGTPMEIVSAFGGMAHYQEAVNELEYALYCA